MKTDFQSKFDFGLRGTFFKTNKLVPRLAQPSSWQRPFNLREKADKCQGFSRTFVWHTCTIVRGICCFHGNHDRQVCQMFVVISFTFLHHFRASSLVLIIFSRFFHLSTNWQIQDGGSKKTAVRKSWLNFSVMRRHNLISRTLKKAIFF